MRALTHGALWGLVAALLMAAGGLFLRHDFADQRRRDARAQTQLAARWLGQTVAQEAALRSRLLTHACQRDVHVERLTLELAAGAEAPSSAARVADGLSTALVPDAGGVWLARAARGRLEILARSAGVPALMLDLPLLGRASDAFQLARDVQGRSWLVLACERTQGTSSLWIASVTPAEQLLTLLPSGSSLSARLAQGSGRKHEETALRLDVEQGEPLLLMVRSDVGAGVQDELALLVVVLAAFLLASLAGYVVNLRTQRHEHALMAIERAAERVAQGDLVSAIDLRLGNRADQTFKTFDRMTRELRDMREKLAEAEREAAFREVARRIAHEVLNPLSPIQMAIETLRKAHEKRRADFDEIFEESTRAILEEVRRLQHIVREFGDFARLPKPRPGALDLGALVRDVVALYVPEDIELSLRIAEEAPLVRADREQITQVLVNLLKNALDAARASAPPRIEIEVAKGPEGTRLVVSDNGPGIAPDARERVLEPYYTTKEQGTGLGLAIVKRIVLEHRGRIEFTDSPLGGASASVTLPAHDEDAQSTSMP